MKHPVEIITWIDHSHSMGDDKWSEGELIQEANTEFQVITVGFIIAESEDQVIQATEIVPVNLYRRWWRIRKELIVSRELLPRPSEPQPLHRDQDAPGNQPGHQAGKETDAKPEEPATGVHVIP